MTTPLSPRGLLILEAVRCAQALPGGMRIKADSFGSVYCGCPITALARVCGRKGEGRAHAAARVLGCDEKWVMGFIAGFDAPDVPWGSDAAADGRALRALLLPAAPTTGAAC